MNYPTFDVLLEKLRNSGKNYDFEKIQAAYDIADEAHGKGPLRKSGEPYITHPIAVADILSDHRMDTDTLVAALLHDVVEDTDVPLEVLRRKFGDDVAELVDGVTKIRKMQLKSITDEDGLGNEIEITDEDQEKAEDIRKILLYMIKDIRVIIIKLADRLHNMRTLKHFRDEKRRRISLESMTFYAPIAHRLGIADIKDELETLSLFYLDNYAYREIESNLITHKDERILFIEKIKSRIRERLSYMNPAPAIEGRVKGIYGLYRKMYVKGKELDEIYDLYAVRVIVSKVTDCYSVMGEIHEIFTPIPKLFKDYIAAPKMNAYQSLHTVVLGKEGQPFEVQIRTRDMHNTARYGVAAHWRYKLGGDFEKQFADKFDFIREMLEQQQTDDASYLAEAIKTDLSPDQVYIFTPKGSVRTLALGSTVVDFAYSVHTDIGNKMKGAKILGKAVGLSHVLSTGDVVEILLSDSPGYGPNRSWLEHAKTSDARHKISRWLKKERREENLSSGKAYVEGVLKSRSVEDTGGSLVSSLAKNHRFANTDAFYSAIGYGGVKYQTATKWIESELKRYPELVNPIIEESVESQESYVSEFEITAINRRGLLRDIIKVASEHLILSINDNSNESNVNFKFNFVVELESEEQLKTLFKHLDKIAGVITIDNCQLLTKERS